MITEPTVRLLNLSKLTHEVDDLIEFDSYYEDAVNAAVFAGRACYQSFGKTYEPTRKDSDYIESTVHSARHLSILEHASVAFYVTGVSRSLSHEFVRHRHFGYSQLSQRYVESNNLDWVCPPEYQGKPDYENRTRDAFNLARDEYEKLTAMMLGDLWAQGIKGTEARKRARQSARSVLPNCTETRMVISGNHRAWLDMLAQRWSGGAEVEIRNLVGNHILPRLREVAEDIYSHVPDDYTLTGVPTLRPDGLLWVDGALHRVVNGHLELVRAGER